MTDEQPRGILRNAQTHEYHTQPTEYDRKVVLENTKKNAELFKSMSSEGEKIREQLSKRVNKDESVQFNRENLEENDKLKASMTFTKIDEPKTPFQGPVSEDNDYYRSDNEGDDIPDFNLGEAEVVNEPKVESLNGGVIDPSNIKEEPELSGDEKHKRFEELRKKHYHNEVVNPLKSGASLLEEEEEEEEEN